MIRTIRAIRQICVVGDVMQRRHTQAQSRRKFTDGVADAAPGYAVSGVSRWSRTKAHPDTAGAFSNRKSVHAMLLEHEAALERLKQKRPVTDKVLRNIDAKENYCKRLRREVEGMSS